MPTPTLILLILTTGLVTTPLVAAQHESHDRIREAARQHILDLHSQVKAEDIKVQPSELDRRLRLARCDQPLESFSPTSSNSGSRQTVGVRCTGKNSWTLYVTVHAEIKKTILVAKQRLERGTILSRGDLVREKRVISGLRGGYIEELDQALGSELRLTLKRGAALSPKQIRWPPAVKRGSLVTILGRTGAIEVRMSGKALSDGAMGERIKVINSSSDRQVEGIVTARGTVEVTL